MNRFHFRIWTKYGNPFYFVAVDPYKIFFYHFAGYNTELRFLVDHSIVKKLRTFSAEVEINISFESKIHNKEQFKGTMFFVADDINHNGHVSCSLHING
jgi:hypothetical protein